MPGSIQKIGHSLACYTDDRNERPPAVNLNLLPNHTKQLIQTESERMERTIPISTSQRPPNWSSSEPSISLPTMTKKEATPIRRTVTKEDKPTKANDPQLPKPPPSPPTSPPLAVSTSFFNTTLNGNNVSDPLIANVGNPVYVATLPPREWFQLLVASLPPYAFTASNQSRKVLYSRKRDISSKEAERIRQNRVQVVGFDLEWKPMRDWAKEYNKVSLVQIATADEILLVQLPESSKFPSGLQVLLEDPAILKVGAGIQNDVDKLKRDWKVNVRNYLDLAFLARYHDYFWDTCDVLNNHCINGAFGGAWCDGTGTDALATHASSTPSNASSPDAKSIQEPNHDPAAQIYAPLERLHGRPVYPPTQPVALARLVARYLGRRLDKECQLSNWAAPLSEKQIEYAANDGCSSLDVYNTLIRLRDHTPGWTEAQAMFYRMVIEYHRTLTTPTSPYRPRELMPPKKSTSATPEEEETVFTMEGDDTRTAALSSSVETPHTQDFIKLLNISGAPHLSNSVPALHRSLSDPNIIKAAADIPVADGAASKRGGGSRPLYPSPPVTPTRNSILPALPSSAPRSAPTSPVLAPRLPVPEAAKDVGPSNPVEPSKPVDAPSHKMSRWNSRKLKQQREIYSISHPNSLSYANKRAETGSDSERARRLSDGTLATAMQQSSAPASGPMPSNAYYGGYTSARPSQPSPVRNGAAMHVATPSNTYFPPTPATPYPSRDPYATSGYYGVPASYPQPPPPVPHNYSYPTAVPYAYSAYPTYPQHAYPYAQPQSQPQPQGYYYWSQDMGNGNHGYWPAQNTYAPQTSSSSEPPAQRPSLRYSGGSWYNVDTCASAPSSAAEDTRAGGDAWVLPTPHGIPTPQVEGDVKAVTREGVSESTCLDSSGWVSGDHVDSNQQDSMASEESPAPRMIYVGDVALQSELYSDNVRFNSVTGGGGVSFSGLGNADDEARPLAPEIYA